MSKSENPWVHDKGGGHPQPCQACAWDKGYAAALRDMPSIAALEVKEAEARESVVLLLKERDSLLSKVKAGDELAKIVQSGDLTLINRAREKYEALGVK